MPLQPPGILPLSQKNLNTSVDLNNDINQGANTLFIYLDLLDAQGNICYNPDGQQYNMPLSIPNLTQPIIFGQEEISGTNAAPGVGAIVSKDIYKGDTYISNSSFFDSGSTNWTAKVDYGDGSGLQSLILNGTNFSLNHQYNNPGTYSIKVNITDNQGATGTTTATVNVINKNYFTCDSINYTLGSPTSDSSIECDGISLNGVHLTSSDITNYIVSLDLVGGDHPNLNDCLDFTDFVPGNSGKINLIIDYIYKCLPNNPQTIYFYQSDLQNNSQTYIAEQSFQIGDAAIAPIFPSADSYIKKDSPNENEGASTVIKLDKNGKGRGLIRFDETQIQNAVGTNQNFTAKLQLTITNNDNNWGSNGRNIGLHRLFKDWTEGNGTETNRGTNSGTTWNCAIDSNIANHKKNCDDATEWEMLEKEELPFISSPSAKTLINNNQNGVIEFDVTKDVKNFLNGTYQNYGWLLKKTDENKAGKIEFGSRESTNSPKLIITTN